MTAGPSGGSADDEVDPRPIVELPRPAVPGAVIAIAAAVLATLLFLMLDARRLERARTPSLAAGGSAADFADPPALRVPSDDTPAPIATFQPSPIPPAPFVRPTIARTVSIQPLPIPTGPPPLPAQPGPPATVQPRNDPALVVDGGAQVVEPESAPAAEASADDAPTGTTVIRNHTAVMPAGTVIPAVLETPIDSSRGGLVRALVAEDARGFDGKRILIPRGSRLIGDYAADVHLGQKRVLVTWRRLIRPDGVAIRIGSPAADPLGGAGVPGRVNTFFLQRFAGAVLQSALSVGVNLASRRGDGSVFVGIPESAGGTIGQDLVPTNDLKPRIRVKEGAVLSIFVARDLDFSAAPVLRRRQGS